MWPLMSILINRPYVFNLSGDYTEFGRKEYMETVKKVNDTAKKEIKK